MFAGCFSCCRLLMPWGFRKRISETKSDETPPEIQLVIVPATKEYTTVLNGVNETKSDEKLSEDTRTAAPTTNQYIIASGKEVLKLLQSAAGVIPVPLLQDAIGVAIKIIEVCEAASAVEGKVKELQDRVGNLMVVIVAHVTSKNEEDSIEVVINAAKDIEHDIRELLSILETINGDLTTIRSQNRLLTTLYQEPNMSRLEDCLTQLTTALEKFNLANDLRNSDLLHVLQTRLWKMDSKFDKISKDVEHLSEEFHEFLARIERPTMLLPSETVIREDIPLKPVILYGRDGLVEEIVQCLMKKETSRVCILGPGGMGKTSVSLAVVESSLVQERFPHGNVVWVPCIGATSVALFREILAIQLGVPTDKQVTLEKIISALSTSEDPRLILLDNFETPWNAPGVIQTHVEGILRRLADLDHIAIFITMRGNHPPCNNSIKWQSKKIEPTDEEACLRIFHATNPSSKDDLDVSSLLRMLGYMPFAVTLMANLGMEAQWTAKELMDAWSESGPDIFSDGLEQSMNRSISLSVDSDLVKQNPNALLLLAILASLPAGTTKENLRWWARTLKTSMVPSAIATLLKAALVVENKQQDSDSSVLFVVPVVQSFMQQRGRISEEVRGQIYLSCCQYVLDHACRYDDPSFPVKSKALAAEDTNIQSILFHSAISRHTDWSNVCMEALIAFAWHRCDTKPSSEIASHVVTVAKTSGIEIHMASALWCLGRSYHQLSEYRLSYDHLQEANRLFNTLPPNDLKLQRLGGRCGIDLAETALMELQPTETVTLAESVEEKCAVLSDELIHGRSLLFLGEALGVARRPEDALRHLNRALPMLKAVNNTSNLAEAYQVVAHVHYEEHRLPEALEAITEAWKQAEMSNRPYIQACISLDFGMFLFDANRDTEAWNYSEIALTKALHVGNQGEAAMALEYMGYGYLRRGDYRNAYNAYEAAAKKYLTTQQSESEWRCKDNMDRIEQKWRNPDVVVGFRRLQGDNDTSLLFPPVQLPASDVLVSSS